MTIRVYLDTSVYNRPFDDQTQPRIWLETLAFSAILQMIEEEKLALVTSSIVAYEASRNPFELRRLWIDKVTKLASTTQLVNNVIRQRAVEMEQAGLAAYDALHLACAETAGADYFITSDDKLIRRYRTLAPTTITVCNPTEAIRLLEGE